MYLTSGCRPFHNTFDHTTKCLSFDVTQRELQQGSCSRVPIPEFVENSVADKRVYLPFSNCGCFVSFQATAPEHFVIGKSKQTPKAPSLCPVTTEAYRLHNFIMHIERQISQAYTLKPRDVPAVRGGNSRRQPAGIQPGAGDAKDKHG